MPMGIYYKMLAIYAINNPQNPSLYISIKTLHLFLILKKTTLDFQLLKKTLSLSLQLSHHSLEQLKGT